MEEKYTADQLPMEEEQIYYDCKVISPEITEIEEDSKSIISTGNRTSAADVYVAAGKNDLHVVKWTLDHAISPGDRIFLVHVFTPLSYISTPVGRLSRSQLSKEQLQVYINEENNKRRSLLEQYIRLCNDAKVAVDTMLLESNSTTKAILDLIPVVNITSLIMGTKRSPSIRRSRKGQGKGEYVQKNAPDYCKVTIIYDGKKITDGHAPEEAVPVPPTNFSSERAVASRPPERNFLECMCFSGKSID